MGRMEPVSGVCDGAVTRKVVNTIKNEILTAGKTAALNVDRRNPVTNHLYRALGFEPVFAQGEYRRGETKN